MVGPATLSLEKGAALARSPACDIASSRIRDRPRSRRFDEYTIQYCTGRFMSLCERGLTRENQKSDIGMTKKRRRFESKRKTKKNGSATPLLSHFPNKFIIPYPPETNQLNSGQHVDVARNHGPV